MLFIGLQQLWLSFCSSERLLYIADGVLFCILKFNRKGGHIQNHHKKGFYVANGGSRTKDLNHWASSCMPLVQDRESFMITRQALCQLIDILASREDCECIPPQRNDKCLVTSMLLTLIWSLHITYVYHIILQEIYTMMCVHRK